MKSHTYVFTCSPQTADCVIRTQLTDICPLPCQLSLYHGPTGRQTPMAALAASVQKAQKSHAFGPSRLVLQLAFPHSGDTVWLLLRFARRSGITSFGQDGQQNYSGCCQEKLQKGNWTGMQSETTRLKTVTNTNFKPRPSTYDSWRHKKLYRMHVWYDTVRPAYADAATSKTVLLFDAANRTVALSLI
jgi:hypothetical protein